MSSSKNNKRCFQRGNLNIKALILAFRKIYKNFFWQNLYSLRQGSTTPGPWPSGGLRGTKPLGCSPVPATPPQLHLRASGIRFS